MMEQKEWLWKQKSSEKSHCETESSDPESSHSEKYSDEQQEALKESPMGTNQSPDVTSKAMADAEAVNDSSFINAQSPEGTSKLVQTMDNINDCVSEEGENGEKGNVKNVNEGDVNDGLRTMSEKLSAALVNVSAKEDLVKQHAKVAEEAIAGWEKAENEVASLKKQLEALTLRNSTLEDQVSHLDGALKECVRQLRQRREEQEQNIHDAVVKKTHDLESSKIKLENQLMELQNKLEASNARSPSSVDLDMCQKVEYLEKENMALKRELLAQSEELEIMTIERDLSTQAAETASKQHLDSIKKVARLEAECRRLKNMASRASLVNDHKSSIDSQSDSGDRLNAAEIDTCKMSGPELDRSEPGCSESWASALIAELDQFKTEKCRTICCSSVKIDLMDDFLEMERLAALPDTKSESLIRDSVVADQCINEESSLRDEFDKMNQQMDEVKEKLEKVESEKDELQITLMKNEECIEASQLKLREAEMKLEELQRELENAYKSKQMMENKLMSMEAEAQTITAKVHLLEAEVDRERAISDEIASKCKELEEELESKKQEVDNERAISDEIASKYKELEEELESKKQEEKLRSTASSCVEMKIKQEDLAVAAGKLAECQKTIASLGNQLKSLATLEDFLIDTASIPEFSASPSLIARAGGELWKLHSNDTYSPKRDSSSSRLADGSYGAPLNKSEESSPPSSSSSSTTLPNNVSSEKSRNGFAKFFSQTKNGLRLEI